MAAANRLPHAAIFRRPDRGWVNRQRLERSGSFFYASRRTEPTPSPSATVARYLIPAITRIFISIQRKNGRLYDKSGTSKAITMSIDVIRHELVDPAGRKPLMNVGKVFLIEEADSMAPVAQNSTLKTLEEPAGRALIILITDSAGTLLPTIRSRCQIVQFAALDEALVKKELIARGTSAQDAADAARVTEGSLGAALKWINDGVLPRARDLAGKMKQTLAGNPATDLPEWFKKAAADAYTAKQLEYDELASKDQATREGLCASIFGSHPTHSATLCAIRPAKKPSEPAARSTRSTARGISWMRM